MSPLSNDIVYRTRAALRSAISSFLGNRGYTEVDAPIIVYQPGTEVHLDYFETSWSDFQGKSHNRFLRSSPELHLKQALSHGLNKVYHLGKCFRNGGELSEWHNPEFTMLEWYEANISYTDYMQQTEDLVKFCWRQLQEKGYQTASIPETFSRVSVKEAFWNYAGIELIDGDRDLNQKAIERGYISVRDTDDFETSFFKIMLDIVEPKLKDIEAVFLYDYPASQAALAKVEEGVAKRFELYLYGVELCNAFLELTDPVENRTRIEDSVKIRASLNKQTTPVDISFLEAVERGLPPCCGNALGFDRLLAIILGRQDLRDVIPFHSNQIYPLEH